MDQHLGFIVAAFVITGLVLAVVIASILLDYRTQLRALARLSALNGAPSGGAARQPDDVP